MPIIPGAIVAPEMHITAWAPGDHPEVLRRQDDRRARHGTKPDDDDAGALVAGGVDQRTRRSDSEHAKQRPR